MRRLIIALLILSLLAVPSFATSVTVTNARLQSKYGTLTYIYFETVSGPSGTTPGTNSAQTPSGSSGSYSVPRGTSAYLWSPQFASSSSISAGIWVMDLWARGSSSGTIRVSIYVTDSSGTAQSTIASNIATPTIGTTETQVVNWFSVASTSIPANGYIEVVLTAPTGAGNPGFTLYWGSGQQTNFQVPFRVLT